MYRCQNEEYGTVDAYLKEQITKSNQRHWVLIFVVPTLLTALAAWILFGFVFELEVVRGNSMNPGFYDGQLLLASRTVQSPEFGDVVILNNSDSNDYIKRIVGLPGDTLNIDNESGRFIRNGEILDEPYAWGKTLKLQGGIEFPVTLQENEYFVLGDNREHSNDSRYFGSVDIARIKAKITLQSSVKQNETN